MYDPETAGYLAKSAFLRTLGISAGIGAGLGGVAGAVNNDGHTGLGTRVMRGAVGGAIGGAALTAAPSAWGKVRPYMNPVLGKVETVAGSTAKPLEHKILGGVGGITGGVMNTGGDSN